MSMSSIDLGNVIASVDMENIYRHVLRLEGIRHPIVDPAKLNATADYIADHFRSIGADRKMPRSSPKASMTTC